MENLPTLLCIGFIAIVFVVPMWLYIYVSEYRARKARDKAIEAGRHEPVTIQPFVDLSVCMGSGMCVPACPEHVLTVIDGQAVAINMSACIGHGACVPACPVGAIELVFGSEKRGIDIPRVGPDFQTNVPGVFIAGELGGMGLIASAAEQGVKALESAAKGLAKFDDGRADIIIVGAGPAGIAAAASAKLKGINYVLLDQDFLGGAVRHYPRKKLVFTRPMDMPGYGKVNLRQLFKEELVSLFEDVIAKVGIQVDGGERVDKVKPLGGAGNHFEVTTTKRTLHGQRVILALGRRGTPRKLDVPGEEQEKVAYSLLEPEHYQYDHLLIVGGGDSAVEAALQLSEQPGNTVTLSYRGDKINRPKDKNIKRLQDAVKAQQVTLMLESQVTEVGADRVSIEVGGESSVIPNDYVFVMVGGVLPTKFLQNVGIKIQKHFGKRIEGMDEERSSQTKAHKVEKAATIPPPSPLPMSFISAPKGRGNEEPTMALPIGKSSEEPTMSLPAAQLEELVAALTGPVPSLPPDLRSPLMAPPNQAKAAEPKPGDRAADVARVNELAALAREAASSRPRTPVPAPPVAPPPTPVEPVLPTTLPPDFGRVAGSAGDSGGSAEAPADYSIPPAPSAFPSASVAAPGSTLSPARPTTGKPVSGLALLDTKGWPAGKPGGPEALDGPFLQPARPGYKPEYTEIQPLKKVKLDEVARRETGPVPQSPSNGGAPAANGPGSGAVRSPARQETTLPRPETTLPQPDEPPEPREVSEPSIPPPPASPISMRMSRVVGKGVNGSVNPDRSRSHRSPIEVRATEPTADPRMEAVANMLAHGHYDQVLELARELPKRGPEGERLAPLLEGQVHLARGSWSEAIPHLERAVETARNDGVRLAGTAEASSAVETLGRACSALGRAYHHAGRFNECRAMLVEATRHWQPPPLERAAILRLLGDLSLRNGDLETSEQRWTEALEVAQAAGSPDAEARALRGLASCTALRGHYPEALDQLGDAMQLLQGTDPDPMVLTGILIRKLELESVLGRYGRALESGEALLELTRDRIASRAEAVGLLSEVLAAVGLNDEAAQAAGEVASLVRRLGVAGVDPGIRAARALCEVGRSAEALAILDDLVEPPESPLDDLASQRDAVRARALAPVDPVAARELANRVLTRPAPLLAIRTARIRLDAAVALHEAGADSASGVAVKRGLKAVQGSGNKGLKLELLIAMYLASPDYRVVEAAGRTAMRVLEDLPPHAAAAFRSRRIVAEALARYKAG